LDSNQPKGSEETMFKPIHRHARLFLALLSSVTFGASCAPDDADDAAEETDTIVRAINPSASCFSTTPDITFRGGGKVLTPATYDHATCPRAYMVSISQYSASNTLGTTAAYVGPTPTTQAACENTHMIAYVWRSNGTFLASVDKRGTWGPDIRNVNRCRLPSVNLEQDTPGYKAGASWVIGLQAREGTSTFRKISFATIKAGTAAELLANLATLNSTLNAVAAGSVHRAVQEVFDRRNTPSGARLCRVTQLDKQISALTRQSVIRVGATATAAANRDTALAAMYTAMCTSTGTAAGLQTAIKQYATAQLSIRNGMRAALATLVTNDQAGVLAAVNRQALGELVSRCALKPGTVLSFLYDGALPAGKTGDNLLTGSCSGTPSQVAINLGIGSNFTGDTLDQARNRFNDCLTNAFEQDRCNDPRADGAPDEAANPVPAPDDAAKKCVVLDENRPCTAEEEKGLSDEDKKKEATADAMNDQAAKDLLQAEADRALGAKVSTHLNTVAADAAVVAGGAVVVGSKIPVAAPAAAEVAAGAGLVSAVSWAGSAHCAEDLQACGRFVREVSTPQPGLVWMQQCDGVGNCFTVQTSPPIAPVRPPGSGDNRMCAPEFATGGPGWFETDGPAGAGRPLNQNDRIQHCTCELLDGKYAGRNNAIAVSGGCPTPEEKFRQDCLTEPYQPRATPNPTGEFVVKPACLAGLSPPVNVQTRMTKICNAVNCGPGGFRLTSDDGSCSCIQAPTDPAQGLPCRNSLFAMCTDGDPVNGSCGCVPTDTVPLGNDPFCRYTPDDATWPGLLTGFSVVNTRDLFATQFNATQQFAMLRPNRSVVGPTIFKEALTAVPVASTSNPPALRLNALLSKKPPVGGNIDLQIYITSRGTPAGTLPLIHDFAGQVRLNDLAVGTPTAMNIPLFAGANQQTMLSRAFNGKSLNIEYTVQGPSGYSRFVGIGSQAFVGASTALPTAGLAPICPRPSPILPIKPVVVPNPLAPFATPTNPGTFTLSSGQISLLTDRVPVLRTLAP
jgi:hypothetical protein